MKDKLVLQGKLEIKNAHIVIDGIDLANALEHGSSVFMVVEPLPESKPEKNCGNCGFAAFHTARAGMDCFRPAASVCRHYSAWVPKQPKPAEPQGWGQRFCEDYCRDGCKPENRRTCKQLAFIRAEIDRAWGDGFKAGHDIAEENRSNE